MALIDYGTLALYNHRLFGSKALNKGSCLRNSNHDKISIIATLKGVKCITPIVEFNSNSLLIKIYLKVSIIVLIFMYVLW